MSIARRKVWGWVFTSVGVAGALMGTDPAITVGALVIAAIQMAVADLQEGPSA